MLLYQKVKKNVLGTTVIDGSKIKRLLLMKRIKLVDMLVVNFIQKSGVVGLKFRLRIKRFIRELNFK